MNENAKKDLEDGGKHALHGLEDVVDVVGHAAGGTVKGVADGVEDASAETKVREADEG